MSRLEHTRTLILKALVRGPLRSSELREIVMAQFPQACMTAIQDLQTAGRIVKLSQERNGKWKMKTT